MRIKRASVFSGSEERNSSENSEVQLSEDLLKSVSYQNAGYIT